MPAAATPKPAAGAAARAEKSGPTLEKHDAFDYGSPPPSSMESFQCLQFPDRVLGADFSTLQPLQNLGSRRLRVGLNELQTVRNSCQPRLDGRIADSKNLLHLLNRAMTADKRRYEYLIFQAQSRQLRKLKGALDSHVLIHDPHPLHHDWLPFRELRQFLPVTGHSLSHPCSIINIFNL